MLKSYIQGLSLKPSRPNLRVWLPMNHYQIISLAIFCAALCGCLAPQKPHAVDPRISEGARGLKVLQRVSGSCTIHAMVPYLQHDILSPDGSKYVFMAHGTNWCESEARVVVGDTASGAEVILPISGTNEWRWVRWPVWFSDSRTLLCFAKTRNKDAPEYAVFGLNADTGKGCQLLRIRELAAKFYVQGERTLVFSVPDGKQWRRKAYDLCDGGVVDVDDGIPAHVVPVLSPDGRHAAYCIGGYKVIVRDISGGKDRHIRRVSASALAWSPDGRYLLVVGYRPTRCPVAHLRMWIEASDAIEHVLDGYTYDTKTGNIVRMAVNERLLEKFLAWRSQKLAPRPPVGR